MQRENTTVGDEHANESMQGASLHAMAATQRQGVSATSTYSLTTVGTTVDDGGGHTDPPDVDG